MATTTSAHEFIDNELILYSAHSNIRSIPFLGDGFKQAQRKAIWGMLERGENADKDTVERLSSRICSTTDYHHGSTSMEGTIVCMAQPSANNVPLIAGFGQFGNRLNKKASASRYIKATLSPNFRKLFKKEDDIILTHHYSNGDKIEPIYFIPILPLSLINGAEGMGTGHSTYILGYSAEKLRTSTLALLHNKKLVSRGLLPEYSCFTGTVTRDPITAQITITGKADITSNCIHVTELPIGIQKAAYVKHLNKLVDKELIKSFDDNSDESGFDYVIVAPKTTTSLSEDEIYKMLNLVSKETENLTLWSTAGVLTKYNSVEEILVEFVEWRLDRYEDRRQALIALTNEQIAWISEKIRFVDFYLQNTDLFKSNGKKQLLDILTTENFLDSNRLLSMQIWSLTKDYIDDLQNQLTDKNTYLQSLVIDTPVEMYKRELSAISF